MLNFEWQYAEFKVPKHEVMDFVKEFTKMYYIKKIQVNPDEETQLAHVSIHYRDRGDDLN